MKTLPRACQALAAALLAVAACVAPAAATAANAANGALPAAAPQALLELLPQARLGGAGTFRWLGLRIYDARLWVGPQGVRADGALAQPFVLELCYARALDGARIAEASVKEMEKVGAGDRQSRAGWLAAMRGLFPDVRENDCLAGHFMPGQGARFYFNGRAQGEPQDAAFAQAFFAIWLSPATSAPELRAALLRSAAPAGRVAGPP